MQTSPPPGNNLNYVDYDFNNVLNQLISRIRLKNDWKDTYRSGTGQMLLELHAYLANMILYYIERRAEESYLGTAKNLSSIIQLVRLIGYQPYRSTSATGVLTFSLNAPLAVNVFIPKYTQCTSSTGFGYVTTDDAVIIAGATSVSVNAIQGSKVEVVYSSDGSINREIALTDTNIENDNVFVIVDGTSWSSVDSFINSVNTSQVFSTRQEMDSSISILFGDNVFGKAPAANSSITVRYIKSDGLSGNVYQAGLITTVASKIYDANSNLVVVNVTNADVFLGGSDPETAEHIRYQAPRVFATAGRGVTRADIETLIDNYSGVADANVWGEAEESTPNYNNYNQVKLSFLLQNWVVPSTAFQTAVLNYLQTLAMMTVRYVYVAPTVLNVIPYVDIYAVKGKNLSQIQSDVQTALENQFLLGSTSHLSKAMRLSDVYNAIDSVDGLSYSHTVLNIRKDAAQGGGAEWSAILDALNVAKKSVQVWKMSGGIATQMGVDDGAGGWTAMNSSGLTGTVSYTTGQALLNFAPDINPPDSVYLIYQNDNAGDIITSLSQICYLYAVNVTSIQYIA